MADFLHHYAAALHLIAALAWAASLVGAGVLGIRLEQHWDREDGQDNGSL